MKKAELYAGLDWGTVELLIPQSLITDAGLEDAGRQEPSSIDEAVGRAFQAGLPCPKRENGFQSVLVISGRRYRTALMPKTVSLAPQDRQPGCRILQGTFSRHGLLAIRFAGDTIQYIVDMARFTAGENE